MRSGLPARIAIEESVELAQEVLYQVFGRVLERIGNKWSEYDRGRTMGGQTAKPFAIVLKTKITAEDLSSSATAWREA
jgi:hypothetical protein